MQEICFFSACELADLIAKRELSCREVVQAHLNRIEAVNPSLNAIVTLVAERALDQALRQDNEFEKHETLPPLYGLPVAHKDLALTKGVKTTFGSTVFRHHVPDEDSLIVTRLRQAGAIMVGKTNTPEFGAGSQTFNAVFGKTRNPYNLSKTCGGSSGGAAAALAAGLVPIADGSDMGGSLRNPAAFCNVVGLRPTPGRVPIHPTQVPGDRLGVEGPMARRVEDVALMLDAISGPAPDTDPCLLEKPNYRSDLDADFNHARIAFSPDFQNQIQVAPEVSQVVAKSRDLFVDLGATVLDEVPSFEPCDEIFQTLRAQVFAKMGGELIKNHKEQLKDTLIWNIEQGLNLTPEKIKHAMNLRERFQAQFREFMDKHDFLVLPTTQVSPFDVDHPYVTEINGNPLHTYLDWMASCCYITTTEHPAISVPCGFDKNALPVGLQIVGQQEDELGVLRLAYAIQQTTQHWQHQPTL